VKRLARALAYGVLALLIIVIIAVTGTIGWRPFLGPRARPLTARTFAPTPGRLERGAYLVNNVVGCLYCHSDFESSGSRLRTRAGTEGGGHVWNAEDMPWLVAPNITPDNDTGAGNWSDDAIARAVREGIGHDGRALFPMMPYGNLRTLADEDLASVVVYLRTLKPIRRELPRSTIPFPVNRLINSAPRPVENAVPPPDLSNPVARGRYLVTLASCGDCHTPMDDKGQQVPGMEFSGGHTLKYEGHPSAASANLTPSPNGIPYYTEALFVETIRTGRVRERALSELMPWTFYRGMSDEDLKAIFAYLKTLAPVDHYVDNTLPPTKCVRCNLEHGGGERNKKAS
jgi:mono/diheme cytochrome c family protein